MVRKTLIFAALLILISSIAYGAPVVDLKQGQTQAGYTYQNFGTTLEGGGLSVDAGDTNTNTFYVETGIGKNLVLGLEVSDFSKTYNMAPVTATVNSTFTDVYLQYGLDDKNQFRLMVGNRNYDTTINATDGVTTIAGSGSTSKFFYGAALTAPLGDKFNGYASFKKSSIADDLEIGLTYQFDKNTSAVLNYRNYKEEDSGATLELNGIGFGIAFRF